MCLEILRIQDEQVNVNEKYEIVPVKRTKHCGKRIKCWLTAIFPFPQCFPSFFFKLIKKRDCVVKTLFSVLLIFLTVK